MNNNIRQLIGRNNRAGYDYFIEDEYEAGIILKGTEVKSLRTKGATSLIEAHVNVNDGEAYIYNLYIPEYLQANRFNHLPRRPRKLLLHAKQIKRLIGVIKKDRLAIIPLQMYFNRKNLVKLIIAVCKGKKTHDKRETIKQREWIRKKSRKDFE